MPLVTSATISITTNVRRCSGSEIANDMYGGTKKKSNASTLRMDATTVGPRDARVATPTTPRRYTMIRLDRLKWENISQAAPVQPATTARASPYEPQSGAWGRGRSGRTGAGAPSP